MVTGASRGGGRGIALVLGEEGAIVYVTGRSVRGGTTTENRPETIEDTAEAVTARGGVGIPVRCDHTVDADVEALFARVRQEHGRLDILVNNAWGGEEVSESRGPFWERPLQHWEGMFTAGVRAHIVASRLAVPLMLPHGRGLIINTTFSDQGKYLGNLFYDLAMNAISRLAYGMAADLRKHNVAAVALSPGWMRTERVLDSGPTPEDLAKTESTEYVGRAVAALAADPAVMQKTGSTLTVGGLAREYGFTDVDGRLVPPFLVD